VVNFIPQLFYPWGKNPQYLFDRLGGPLSQSDVVVKRKISLPHPCSESNPNHYIDWTTSMPEMERQSC